MDTTSSPPPEKESAPPKNSRRAFGASATLARRRLSNKVKFESRTGQNVAAASAASNTERATERGGFDELYVPLLVRELRGDLALPPLEICVARIGAARVVPYEAEKGEQVIAFPLVPRALAEWAHEECAGHPCSNSDVEDMQDAS